MRTGRFKQYIIFASFLILIGTGCFGVETFKLLNRPDITITSSIMAPVQKSLKNNTFSFANIATIDYSGLLAEAGFRISPQSSDTVLKFELKPYRYKWFDFVTGVGYHFYDYFSVFCENDLISEFQFGMFYKDIFRFQLNAGTFYKFTFFRNSNIEDIFKTSIFLGVDFLWNIKNVANIYFSISSIDYFDYSLLGTPFFKLGFNLKFDKNVIFGADYTVKLIDMIAVAENISEMMINLFVKVSL